MILEIKNLVKTFEQVDQSKVEVLNNLNLEVQKSETVAVLWFYACDVLSRCHGFTCDVRKIKTFG